MAHSHVVPKVPIATNQIAPFIPPLGPQPANPAFYSPEPVTLEMKEKVMSLSGDDFTITTTAGTPVLKCKGKVVSLHGTKIFTDMQGNEVFTLKKKTFALQKSFVCESAHGYNFEVKGHFSIGSSKSSVHFKNASDGRELELDLKGDWFDRSAAITLDGRPVAEISRKMLNAREIFGSKQTYFVTVAPNVDLTMIAAICVCLDERENEK